MTEKDAEKLKREARFLSVIPQFQEWVNPGYSKRKIAEKCIEAAKTYLRINNDLRAGGAYIRAATILQTTSIDIPLAIRCFWIAGHILALRYPPRSKDSYIKAFGLLIEVIILLIIQKDLDWAERSLDVHTTQMEEFHLLKPFVSEIYEDMIKMLERRASNQLLSSLITKCKFKHAEFLFRVRQYEKASDLFQEIISKSRETNSDKNLVEACCVYACLVAILTKDLDAKIQIAEICKLRSDFEHGSQYSVVQTIAESFQNKNFGAVEEAVYLNMTPGKQFDHQECCKI